MYLALLDTDTLSELLKQRDAQVITKAAEYLRLHGPFTFSAFTRFEITRGYKAKGSATLLMRFRTFCEHSIVLPVTDEIFERAADLWATARRSGMPHGDADLIIAARALESSRTLVTGNTMHYEWISGLKLDDWRKS